MGEASITVEQLLDVVLRFDPMEAENKPLAARLERVLQAATAYLPHQASLHIHRWDGATFSHLASTGKSSTVPAHTPILLEALQQRAPQMVGSQWIVPLCLESLRLGILAVSGLPADSDVPAWIHLLGQQIAAILAYERAQEQWHNMVVFGQALQGAADKHSTLEQMLTACADFLKPDYVNVLFYDSAQGLLQTVATYHQGVVGINLDRPVSINQENTPAGVAWQDRQLLYVPDLTQETQMTHPTQSGLRTVLVAPINTSALALGLVEIGSRLPDVYTPAEIDIFQQMVNTLAIYMDNIDAYENSQKLAKSKALATEIATKLQQQTDMESVLNVTVSELGRALGAKHGRIRLGMESADNRE